MPTSLPYQSLPVEVLMACVLLLAANTGVTEFSEDWEGKWGNESKNVWYKHSQKGWITVRNPHNFQRLYTQLYTLTLFVCRPTVFWKCSVETDGCQNASGPIASPLHPLISVLEVSRTPVKWIQWTYFQTLVLRPLVELELQCLHWSHQYVLSGSWFSHPWASICTKLFVGA